MAKKVWDLYAPVCKCAMKADQKIHVPADSRNGQGSEGSGDCGRSGTHIAPSAKRIAATDCSEGMITRVYHFGKSTTPDQLDQTWVNCLNLFGVEYNA
jgi:hypothetical protein